MTGSEATPLRAWYDRPSLPLVEDPEAASPDIEGAFLTGATKRFAALPRLQALRRLSLREVSAEQVALAVSLPRLEELRIFGYRGADLSPLARCTGLRTLELAWAPKAETLEPLAALQGLEILAVGDLRRIDDFAPLGTLAGLRFLHLTSPVGGAQPIRSLDWLPALRRLEEAWLIGLRIAEGGLLPLAHMPWLRHLSLSNWYPLREFARLSVVLPETACGLFQPWQRDDEGNVLLTGSPARWFPKGAPGMAEAAAKRAAEFAAWQAHYRSLADPLADTTERLPRPRKPRGAG